MLKTGFLASVVSFLCFCPWNEQWKSTKSSWLTFSARVSVPFRTGRSRECQFCGVVARVSAQTDTVTDTAALVTVVALVTLHTDALHATRDEPVAFVLPGTAFRVSAGVAAEMTERGLARMQ